MKTLGLALGLLALGLGMSAGELGARITWGQGASGLGWAALSGELGALSLSGRGEIDLLPVKARLLYAGVKLEEEGFSLAGSAKLLGTGRLDVSAAGEAVSSGDFGGWNMEGKAGLRTTWAAVLSAGVPMATAWTAARLEKSPFWGSMRVEIPLAGGGASTQVALGLQDEDWVSLHLYGLGGSLSSAALEFGATEGAASGSLYLVLYPSASGSASLRLGEEDWQLGGRLRVALGGWSGSLTLSSELSALKFKLSVELARWGLKEVVLEMRLCAGD